MLDHIPPIALFPGIQLYQGDSLSVLRRLPSNLVHAIFTSPPYFQMADYRIDGQYGHEATLAEYLHKQCLIYSECYRVLRDRTILSINIGETSNNYSPVRGKGDRRKSGQWSHRRPIQSGYLAGEVVKLPEGTDLQVPSNLVRYLAERVGFHYIGYRMWAKKGGGDRSSLLGKADGEIILFFLKQVGFTKKDNGRRLHPTYLKPFDSMFLYHPVTHHTKNPCPFPVSLAAEVLDHIAPDDGYVLDPFVGTGSTILAAIPRCKAIGIDLDCSDAIERIRGGLSTPGEGGGNAAKELCEIKAG
jgi:site-specific DNA-methyltransferase (cytosine-N4-specific)